MPARKRKHDEIAAIEPMASTVSDDLQKIRNMWEFAGINQYLFTFGKAVKIPEIDIEDFEQELMKPTPSETLANIGLQLLKKVSSQRGLNHDMLSDYTRRQYLAKAPMRNPFGDGEVPTPFNDLDVFTKIKVLYQLSTWTLHNPNDIRAALAEEDDTEWRIEPLGWDKEDRQYFVFDDDRLYRRTEPAIPEPIKAKPKAKSKKGRNTRSKRRRISRTVPDTSPDGEEENDDATELDAETLEVEQADDGTDGGYLWELIAITLEEYNEFLSTIRKSRDPNEKAMFKRIEDNVIPHLHARAEERQREAQRRAKELQVMQKLATAKRSSRLADKQEKEKHAQEEAEAERKRLADLKMAHKEQERQSKMLEERQSRMMTREQRIKDREVKRILHQEQLAKEQEALERFEAIADAEDSDGRPRMSERQLKADVKKRQEELAALEEEYDEWVFDCAVCGVHGANIDDGTHSIACEECNVWQHSACHGITPEEAESDSFHFVCQDCKDKLANPAPRLKLNFNDSTEQLIKTQSSSEASASNTLVANGSAPKAPSTQLPPKAELHVTPRKSATPSASGVSILSHQSRQTNPNSPTIPVLPRPRSPQAPATFTAPPLVNGFAASLQQVPGVSIPAPPQNGVHIPMPVPPPATPSAPAHSIPIKQDPVQPVPFQLSADTNVTSSPLRQSTTNRMLPATNGASPAMSPPTLTPHQSIAPRPVHQTPIASSHPPAPVFSTPATNSNTNNQSAFANSAALMGSSPGYSPFKQSPPPLHDAVFPPPSSLTNGHTHTFSPATSFNGSQSVSSQRAGGMQGPMIPPVTLSPEVKETILTPPVKRTSPPRFDLGGGRRDS